MVEEKRDTDREKKGVCVGGSSLSGKGIALRVSITNISQQAKSKLCVSHT